MLSGLTAYLDRELSAERLVGIRAANEKTIGALSAEYPHVVLALVVAAALQVAKLAMRLGAGPLQSLKQARPSKHYHLGLGQLRVRVHREFVKQNPIRGQPEINTLIWKSRGDWNGPAFDKGGHRIDPECCCSPALWREKGSGLGLIISPRSH